MDECHLIGSVSCPCAQVPVPRGHDDEPRHSDCVPSGATAGAALGDRAAGGEEAHVPAVAGRAVCARLARAQPRARALPPARARLEHRVLLPVPGPCTSAHAVLLGQRAALRAAARHAAPGAQCGARAHGAPLEPREPASARPHARAATQTEL